MKRARTNQKLSAGKSSSRRKTRKSKKRAVFALLVIFAAVIFIGLGLGSSNNALIPIDTSTGTMNVLLLGVDEDGLRTDAIMVASYDFDEESMKLLSIPRDTRVVVTNRKNLNRKINEVHAMTKSSGEIMGPLASVEAVSTLTGIPINYYVEFSFDAIDSIMDILGPVTFEVPDVEGNGKGMNYDDPEQDLHIHLKPGLQELSGNQVQQFLRYRKSNYGTSDGSDTSRVERQQDFVKALLDQKVNMSLIVKMPSIFSQLKKEIKTNFSSGEIAKYSTHLLNLKQENISSYSLPGESVHKVAWYFECDLDETAQLIETEFGFDADDITNKVEITGEKYRKSSNSARKTQAPKKTEEPENTQKPTQKPTREPEDESEDEPEETQKPTKKPTEAPSEDTEETQKPTRKPTQQPTDKPTKEPEDEDDGYIVIE